MTEHFKGIGKLCPCCLRVLLNEDFNLNVEVCKFCEERGKEVKYIDSNNKNKINGVKLDSIEFDEFQDSYALIYVTKDEEGKPFKYYQENLTKEECEIIYGNIVDTVVIWNMILQEKENKNE